MDFLRIPLFIAFVLATSEAQQRQSNISPGSSLTPDGNSTWLSNSGLYAFGFYKEGNGFSVGIFLAGIREKTVVWTANRDSPPVTSNATLVFTSEGSLVLQSTEGDKYIGDSALSSSSASMLDSGNFVLYNSNGRIIWQSFDHPTDTLLPTQRLLADKHLISGASESDHASGIFMLAMQSDGNLVQYPVKSTPLTTSNAYYASDTSGSGGNVSLVFDSDAHLYLMNSSGVNIRNITDKGYYRKDTIFLMRIDSDGLFRLYSFSLKVNNNWTAEWASSNDKCDPQGLCGLNGFCTLIDQEADCKCLPGFEFVDKGNWTAGCERNFVADSCGNNNKSLKYTMEELPNTSWEEDTYSVLEILDKEGCIQACLDDCNCEAAFYKGGNCKKQRLPLRYGRRSGDSNVALIKRYTSQPTTEIFLPKESDRKVRTDVLIISVFLVSFGLIMLVISILLLCKSNIWGYKKVDTRRSDDVELIGEESSLRSFTYEELERITNGFKEEIGKGSFGTVYKGIILDSQKLVAVKRLDKVLEEGEREFHTEMKAIGRTHHKNLVRLLGYCHGGPNRLLVYEYMSNGSLADMLFSKPENKPLWEERLGIACGIARGILYLHEECETQIIHCDIKPQNILMDEHRCAKISDFGLAKLLKPDQTRTFTGIRGTRGYVAPEWHRKLPITVKADVYSFGIVLLEIICCRRNVIWDLPEDEAILEEWAYSCFEGGRLVSLVGSEEIDKRQLERMVKVALWCIQEEPSMRPSMKKVLLMLEGTVDIPTPPSPEFF